MKAAVLRQPGTPLSIEEVEIGNPGPREVLIRTAAVGLCHSDLYFITGDLPFPLPAVLGHEAAGVVEKVGSAVRALKPGDHVVTCLAAFCGRCEQCATGHLSLCASPDTQRLAEDPPRLALGGAPMRQFLNLSAFAEMMLVHENACVAIRRDMPLDRAAVLGCAVITGSGAVINTAGLRPGETIAVIGCGGIGLSAIAGAQLAGAGRIIAIDPLDSKLAMARTFGATDVVNPTRDDPVTAVRDLTGGGVHHAIECVGLKATAEQALAMTIRGGTAVVLGLFQPGVRIEIDPYHLMYGRRLLGSQLGSTRFTVDIPRLANAYMAGQLNLDALISRHIALADINAGFDAMKTGELARTVIRFPG